MVPPWTPNADSDSDDQPVPEQDGKKDDGKKETKHELPVAPSARFRGARTSLGDFASTGSRDSLRKGVGRYVSTGLGGTSTAVRRMGGTATTAGALYGALGGDSRGVSEERSSLSAEALAGKSGEEIIAVIIETVRPIDGSQEAEASRNSINDALAEVQQKFPEADLLNLNESQREFVIDHFVAMDVFRQFNLDVGKTIQNKAPSATTGVARLKDAREFIREEVLGAFRRLRSAGNGLSGSRVSRIVKNALEDAFNVFSGWAE